MASLSKEKIRLLRDDWQQPGGVNVLAEELYAILGDGGNAMAAGSGGGGGGGNAAGTGSGANAVQGAAPDSAQSPTFTGYGNAPAASFLQYQNAQDPPSNDNLAPLVLNFGGDTPGTLYFDGGAMTFSLDASIADQFEFPTMQMVPVQDGRVQFPAAREVFMGIVQSGAGDTYQVTIYPDGGNQPGRTVTVKQMLIDPDEEIPPGTPAVVVQDGWDVTSGATYKMQVPVWL